MRYTRVVECPTRFIVEDYHPGYMIDFRCPANTTDLAIARSKFANVQLGGGQTEREVASYVGEKLVELGITERADDFELSLRQFSGEDGLDRQLATCLRRLGVQELPNGRLEKVKTLLESTGCLATPPHYPIRLYCHVPGEFTELEADATHYGYVLEGACQVVEGTRQLTLPKNTFFCIAGRALVDGDAKVEVVTRFGYRGMTHYGGEVEPWGRLNYIDGCTDTVLVPPVKRGDPCYNALYFPEFTEQTQHVHPSLRCGLVIAGQGICKTPYGDHPLTRGRLFFLPPETYHSFHTRENSTSTRSALTVIAFHPDSDFGPTDDDHPMVNRTYFKFLHRLVSSRRAGMRAQLTSRRGDAG